MDPNPIEELLTCSICLDRFKQPKLLPCQHTFCLRPCLERLVDNRRICCPQCRAVHKLPPNGIDGFPSNLTIVQLLDVPTQNKPSVSTSCQECEKKNCFVGKCFHCDNVLCRQCHRKHSIILKDELKESISKVSSRIPQLSQKISDIQRCQTGVRENEKAVNKDIEKWFADCMTALQAKKKKLLADVGKFSSKESEMLDEKQEVLQVELAVIKSFCEDAEKQRRRASASEEISEHQASFIEILERSKNHLGQEVDEASTEEYMKFCGEEAQSILDSISNLRGIDIAIRPSAPSIGSSSSQTPSPARQASNSTGRSAENLSAQDPSIVQNYRSKGRVKRCFGRNGSEPGCLKDPWEIAVTGDDEIVVADSDNHRIQIFNASGNSLRTFGRRGGANGEFNDPCGVCVTTSGQIVVADTFNNRIQVFDNQGRFMSAFGQDKLSYPCSVATNSHGSVFVADDANSIKVFSLNGDFIRTFGESWLDSKDSTKYLTFAHDNKVIVSEMQNHRIGVFDESFQLVLEIGTEGYSHGQFNYPRGVACDRHGNMIIADGGNHRIQVFDKDGTFITSFGSEGSRPGQMDCPRGVAVLRNGDVVVSDAGNSRIQIF